MSGRTLVSALVLVLLAAPSAAVAKGVQDAQVCGAAGCVPAPLDGDTYIVFDGAGPTVPAPAERAPFYELRFKTMHGQGADIHKLTQRSALFVPSAGVLRAEDGTWTRADRRGSEAMRRQLSDVAPFPAAKLHLPGVPATADAPAPPRRDGVGEALGEGAAGDGPRILPLLALALLAGGAALAALGGSRRRRRPAAG